MANVKKSKNLLLLCVCFSVLGFVILFSLLTQSAAFQVNFPNSNFLVGILYSIVCILGVTAVFKPKKCQRLFALKEQDVFQRCELIKGSESLVKGHHPNCGKYEGNRIKIHGFVLCSACAGLFVGAIFALVGTAVWFFFKVPLLVADLRFLLFGGGVMLLGLGQFVFRGYLKLAVNALFVVGSFVTLVTADLVGKSFAIDLYAIGLIVFMLLMRILISEWNNRRVCVECEGSRFGHGV